MIEIPTPSVKEFTAFLLGFLLGLPAPYWYSQERIRGLTRAFLDRMPYKPPPGKEREEALEEAVESSNEEE